METKQFRNMLRLGFAILVLLLSVSGWLVLPSQALAQFAPLPAGVECKVGTSCAVGPYTLLITLDRTTFDTTNEYLMTIQRTDQKGGDWQLRAEVVPSGRTSAVTVQYDSDRLLTTGDPSKRQIKGYFPISGTWWIYVTVSGEAGNGALRIATTVEAPPKMPDWLAWTIGLSPIIGIIGFAIGQWRLVMRRKREEALAASASIEQKPANEQTVS